MIITIFSTEKSHSHKANHQLALGVKKVSLSSTTTPSILRLITTFRQQSYNTFLLLIGQRRFFIKIMHFYWIIGMINLSQFLLI